MATNPAARWEQTCRPWCWYSQRRRRIHAGGTQQKRNHMVRAIWNGKVIAESTDTVVVEGNHYFPRDAVNAGYLRDSDLYSVCPWKGKASYHTLEVDGKVNADAAWFYPEPKARAKQIEDRIAFWRGVTIED
jgi:uncharacterized protein (DUF427 family)